MTFRIHSKINKYASLYKLAFPSGKTNESSVREVSSGKYSRISGIRDYVYIDLDPKSPQAPACVVQHGFRQVMRFWAIRMCHYCASTQTIHHANKSNLLKIFIKQFNGLSQRHYSNVLKLRVTHKAHYLHWTRGENNSLADNSNAVPNTGPFQFFLTI